jgi:purine-binding chemotaxis protein CheW
MSYNAAESPFGEKKIGQEYLIFKLGNEEYGVDILKAQEIRSYEKVTRIANSPEFIRGVTNLRGVIVPIIDLRVKFDFACVEFTPETVVIILNLTERVVGILVDSVSDVISLREEQIRSAPDYTVSLSTEYLLGLGAINDRMLILVDIEKLISSKEMQLLDCVVDESN